MMGRAGRPRSWLLLLVGGFIATGALPCHWSAGAATAAAQEVAPHRMGGSPAGPVQEIPIRLTEWALTPAEVVVGAGSAVRFVVTNAGALPHALSVEGDGFYAESAAVGSSQTTRLEITFTAPGVYDLFCPVAAGQHRALGQEGLLTVAGGAPEDAPAPDVMLPDVTMPDAGAPAAAGEALEAEPSP